MRDHTKLRAFELADRLVVEVYKATKKFPRNEICGLTSQVRRAAVSTACNIVEGCGRHGEADYLHFLDVAYDSVRELEHLLNLSSRLGYLREREYAELAPACEETAKVLNGLIRSLRREGWTVGVCRFLACSPRHYLSGLPPASGL